MATFSNSVVELYCTSLCLLFSCSFCISNRYLRLISLTKRVTFSSMHGLSVVIQRDVMAAQRMTSEEKRGLDQLQNDMYSDFRRAAEVHRSVSDEFPTLFSFYLPHPPHTPPHLTSPPSPPSPSPSPLLHLPHPPHTPPHLSSCLPPDTLGSTCRTGSSRG